MLQGLRLSTFKHLSSLSIVDLNAARQSLLATSELSLVKNPCRTTFIVRRKHPVPLLRKYADPNLWVPRKKRHKVYELEQYTEILPEGQISVLLTQLVPGLGEKGDLVTLKRSHAYDKLLLPGLAEYATPEAVEKAKELVRTPKEVVQERFSSIYVHRTMNIIKNRILSVLMNEEHKWVLEPWHIKTALRTAGIEVLFDHSIELPKRKIEGPNLNFQGKEFLVTITINNQEKVQLRCRIHHWHSDIMKRIPVDPLFWMNRAEPLFEEDAEILAAMPMPVPKGTPFNPNKL